MTPPYSIPHLFPDTSHPETIVRPGYTSPPLILSSRNLPPPHQIWRVDCCRVNSQNVLLAKFFPIELILTKHKVTTKNHIYT
jgi:hypothetical protein